MKKLPVYEFDFAGNHINTYASNIDAAVIYRTSPRAIQSVIYRGNFYRGLCYLSYKKKFIIDGKKKYYSSNKKYPFLINIGIKYIGQLCSKKTDGLLLEIKDDFFLWYNKINH